MESALSEDAYPFTLKHFRRRPVNIDRLPSHQTEASSENFMAQNYFNGDFRCGLAASSSTGRLAAVTCIRSCRIIEFYAKFCRWRSSHEGLRTNADIFTESIWMFSLKHWVPSFMTTVVRDYGINTLFFTADQLQEFQEYGQKRYLLYLKGKKEKDGRKELINIALRQLRFEPIYYAHTDHKEK